MYVYVVSELTILYWIMSYGTDFSLGKASSPSFSSHYLPVGLYE